MGLRKPTWATEDSPPDLPAPAAASSAATPGPAPEERRQQRRTELEHQLVNGGVPQRRWAARDLAAFPESAACLGEHLLREPVARVSEAIFTSLKTHANEAAMNSLLPLLRSENAALRNGAIDALGGMPDLVAPRIDTLLQDSDPDVRIFTVNLLADLRHRNVLQWLRGVMQHDPHVNVVAAALEVMAEVGMPQDLPLLKGVQQRFADQPFICFAVDMALQRIGETR